MIRAWIATALLAGSWLVSLGYYQAANPFVWACLIVAAVSLLGTVSIRLPDRATSIAAMLLSVPAALLLPMPYKPIPLLLFCGLALQVAGVPRVWPRRLGQGCLAGSAILLAQGLVIEAYASLTARCHELPELLAQAVGLVPRLLGLDTAVDGSWIVCRSVQQTHRIAATWDLLFDAASVCFLAGGLVLLSLTWQPSRTGNQTWRSCLRHCGRLLVVVLAWAPLRVALLIAIFLQRALRADAIAAPNAADILVNSWVHLALLAIPTLLAIRLIRSPVRGEPVEDSRVSVQETRNSRRARLVYPLLAGLGVAIVVFLWHWAPVGSPKSGRIMVVERHSTWEPTIVPYRTSLYGEAGSYNYAAAFEYCGQYFQMSRLLESESIDDRALSECDVLIIKTPTARYAEEEVAAVVQFVDNGGSLLLVGDHTNVFNMNTYLNDVSRHFGFTFRNDLLFRVGTPYVQKYQPPRISHPAVQHVPPMNFAVSCSIDPGRSVGRMVVRNTGLWNLPPAYQESNYHPQAEYRADMQYGAWCQLWSTTHGRGRVMAFADSTLFSNFCVYQPGKAELLRGMLSWLNHHSALDRSWFKAVLVLPMAVFGLAMLAFALGRGRQLGVAPVLLAAAALAGWSVAAIATIALNHLAMPVPSIQRPMKHVVVDRAVSDVPLFTGAFEDDKEGLGYGMLEQWIPRVGNRISRATGMDVFGGDGLVVICPTRSVSDAYRDQLVQFVEAGGKLLVFDSPDVEGSTANSLLWPFGLSSSNAMATQITGPLTWDNADDVPPIELSASCSISGGVPIATVAGVPTVAQVRYGEGTVTAVGFGSLYNDAAMGYHWLPEPTAETLAVYESLYHLLRVSLPHESTPPD